MNRLGKRFIKAALFSGMGILVGGGVAYATAAWGLNSDAGRQYLNILGINVGPGVASNAKPNNLHPTVAPYGPYGPITQTDLPEILFEDQSGTGSISDSLLTFGGGGKKIQAYSNAGSEFVIVNANRVHLNSGTMDTNGNWQQTGGRLFVTTSDVIIQLGQ
jgi:hypothetical protein